MFDPALIWLFINTIFQNLYNNSRINNLFTYILLYFESFTTSCSDVLLAKTKQNTKGYFSGRFLHYLPTPF